MYTRIGCRSWEKVRKKALEIGYLLGYQYYGCGCFIALKVLRAEMLRMKGIVYLDWDKWREYLEDEVKDWSNSELLWQYNIWKYKYLKQKYLFIKDWVKEKAYFLPKRDRRRLTGSLIKRLTYQGIQVYFTPFGPYVQKDVEPMLYQLIYNSKIIKEAKDESTGIETTY
ncbi:MAG: hypothetical protein JHC30_05475 [Caldisericum sp.]|jgi:hypothetical protein|nr:hypothetical protein [Caldisericum sp.]